MGEAEAKMKIVIGKTKGRAKKFNMKVKKVVGSSLVAAFGLVTGLAWKEVIEVYLKLIVSDEQSKLISAIIITIISVICIVIITKITQDSEEIK